MANGNEKIEFTESYPEFTIKQSKAGKTLTGSCQ
jgi:hypothetical protein